MSTSRPFAYNPSPNPNISGTTQIGDIAIGVDPTLDYFGGAGGVQWWEGPDEDLGYIVAKPIPPLNQPNPLFIPAGVAFGRSLFTEESFILLAESLSSGLTFATGNDASTWLTDNGYWNTWIFISPTPTPTTTPTPTVTPTSINVQTCSLIFNSNTGGIYAYDSSTNLSTFLYNSGFVSNDIANTLTKLWLYSSSIYEYDITLSPWSINFNRNISLSVGLGTGLGAINDTTLISTDGGSDIITLDITTSAATTTVIGSLPPGRVVSGDILQTTTTPPKIIVTNEGGDGYFLSQYVLIGGLAVFETEINIGAYSTAAYGLYEDNSLLYFVDGNSGQIFNVGLNPPYPITATTGNTAYIVYGASQVPSCLNVALTLATPTPTPTNTSTPTNTPTSTQTPTVTQTPTTSTTPNTTPTPTGTPASTPPPTPAPQYYYMSPNSWAPPSIAQSPGDNFSYTNQPLSTLISTSNIDYTTTSWSFSVWGYPQFEYQSLPGGDFYSTLLSLSVPDVGMYPSGSTSLVVSVSYNNITHINDLIVYMSDDVGAQVQWSWAINVDNNSITGINAPAMWDLNNYGSTLNPQHFSNIVISHNNSLIPGNISGSTTAFWNGQSLTLKSCLSGGTYPHISNYTSLDDTRFYLSAGVPGTGWNSSHPLSINTDNPTYYPLTTLSIGNATALYASGVVQPSIPFTTGSAYIWNFDNLPSQHLQCLDKNNGNVADFALVEVNSAAQPITYTLI